GPSGCGKTTLLRLIAGLTEPSSGTVRIGEKPMIAVPPAARDVAMLFQRPARYPNRDVRQNIAFGHRLQRHWWQWFSTETQRQEDHLVQETAACLGIAPLLGRRVHELSGGEQQRVALARCLARQTSVCLLDEPLGHLDAVWRKKLTRELPLLRTRFPATIIVVTHDPSEALALGDRIAVLQAGKIVQADTPEKVRREPANAFVEELFRDARA